MSAHEYKPGDRIIVYQQGKPQRSCAVKVVKQYTRGQKVTLVDGTEWDTGADRIWGTRGERYYNGPSIHPWTEAGAAELLMRVRRNALEFTLTNWSALTDEQRTQIGDIARAIRKTNPNRVGSDFVDNKATRGES